MKYKSIHLWNITLKEAITLQEKLRKKVILKRPFPGNISTVAGIDVSIKDGLAKAAVVVLSYPDMIKIETITCSGKIHFPYVPGLLTFREGPLILKCFRKLKTEPDILLFDGQGIAHPRGIGLASHMGIILEKPAIGSAKSHLYGTYEEPGAKKGDFSIVKDGKGNTIGAALRTRNNIKPVFVSPGHLVDIGSSIKFVLSCSIKYRIPEPIRAAHNAASLVWLTG